MKKMVLPIYCMLFSGLSFAAGFEKAVMWSGKDVGLGSSNLSSVSGSSSIATNPAGLVKDSDLSVNYSPTWIALEGNPVSSNKSEDTDDNFTNVGGVAVNYKVSDSFGVGIGVYAAGGSKAVYESIDYSAKSSTLAALFQPTIQTNFSIKEYAIGGAWEIFPGLRFGAAWRILQAKGTLSTSKSFVNIPAISYLGITDARDTKYNGFRVGVQYQSQDDDWGFGAAFRNSVDVNAEGKLSADVRLTTTGASTSPTSSATAVIGTRLPLAASIGANFKAGDFRFFHATDFVNYKKNEQLFITGTLNGNALPNIPLSWENMWNFRFGSEYSGMNHWAFRVGYVLTTQVTSGTDARATLAPAGMGHTMTAGAGYEIAKNLNLDGALEFAFNSAEGSMTNATTGSGATLSREFLAAENTTTSAKVFGIHTGLTYKF